MAFFYYAFFQISLRQIWFHFWVLLLFLISIHMIMLAENYPTKSHCIVVYYIR